MSVSLHFILHHHPTQQSGGDVRNADRPTSWENIASADARVTGRISCITEVGYFSSTLTHQGGNVGYGTYWRISGGRLRFVEPHRRQARSSVPHPNVMGSTHHKERRADVKPTTQAYMAERNALRTFFASRSVCVCLHAKLRLGRKA